MRPVCLLMIFSLNTTSPHNLIKDKLIDLIEITFQREGFPYLKCNDRNAFFTLEKKLKNIMHGRVNVCDAFLMILFLPKSMINVTILILKMSISHFRC